MHGMSCPKSQLKSTCLTAKFWSFLDHAAETDEKRQNVISFFIKHPISLIFAIHVSFITPLPMMWILLTKPMQKSVTTVCLHCSFARLKNKHIGVLGTNVTTISWLHWSPVSQLVYSKLSLLRTYRAWVNLYREYFVVNFLFVFTVPPEMLIRAVAIIKLFYNDQRSTPLNASAFGVTLDSSVKSRPGQQTKSTSPGRLQFGVIICYSKIKR